VSDDDDADDDDSLTESGDSLTESGTVRSTRSLTDGRS
jgi:hypothetical protein